MTDAGHRRIAIMLAIVMAWAWASILWAAYPAVVRVSVHDRDGLTSHGSGAVVAKQDGWSWVLTNYHVVQDRIPGARAVRIENLAEHTTGHVLAVDRTWDLAVVQCGTLAVDPMPIRVDRPQLGERVTSAGYGHGDYREFHGRIAGWFMPTSAGPADWISTDFGIRSGDSGSPVIDSGGAIVAIAWGTRPDGAVGTYGGRIQAFWRTGCRSGRCPQPQWQGGAVIVRPAQPMAPVIRPARPVAPPVTPPAPKPDYVTTDQLADLEQRILERLDAIKAQQGEPGAPGPQGTPGQPGADGQPGPEGQPGRDADQVALQQLIDEQITARLSEIRGTIRIPIRATAGN